LHGWTWGGCPAGLTTLGIDAHGRIKGCLALPDSLVEGDLRRDDLPALWADPARFAYNRCFTVGDLGGACAGCEHGAACRGGCLELSLTMSGEAHSAPFCLHRIEHGAPR
jgi:radical SAM protein with 4Fe4S-binding SPASM domain